MKDFRFFCLAVLSISSSVAYADLPLTVESITTHKGNVRLDLSLSYANRDFDAVVTGEPVVVPTGPTSSVALPSEVGEAQGNSDGAVGTLGLRYGLSAKAEIYSRASWFYSSSRASSFSEFFSGSAKSFADAWGGVNYLFKEDGDTAAFLGFAEVALREKHSEDSASFKSWMLGATTYHAIDPIVFSLTLSYRLNQVRQNGDASQNQAPQDEGEHHGGKGGRNEAAHHNLGDYKPGNFLLINPSVAFAVNDRVTLTTGFKWTNRQPDAFAGETEDFRRTRTDLLLGVGYGISEGGILNLTFLTNVSGRNGADLILNWLHAF